MFACLPTIRRSSQISCANCRCQLPQIIESALGAYKWGRGQLKALGTKHNALSLGINYATHTHTHTLYLQLSKRFSPYSVGETSRAW